MKTLEEAGYPAFPVDTRDSNDEGMHYFGLSVRDYAAIKTIQGECAKNGIPTNTDRMELLAQRAYQMADAMLKERNK